MQIHSDRRDDFAMPPAELWLALERVGAYRSWWPWLHHLDATSLTPGAVWTAVVQPPLPYRVRFHLRIGAVVPAASVEAEISGDIQGSARLEIEPTPQGSSLRLVSDLGPSSPLLRTVAHLAGPLARLGHEWVLDTGLRQFRDRALS